ncbi:unnamed protein product [Didymodactylos carnosus]|uniref:Uncharacterized protein n=1 Tax=Didymodactylos carnosus TaxID=1234261 RepID=A0A815S2U2_9BILA|nr:unnamed protein product [Didymodactylos carnosus]CAF1482761.1 unnamed protein product [Didymodactylos carnosus]CAF3565246.1 unnamed protein product [Didymodactylos carnosus]CAF4347373.1 unnamed protein product [Didymodactylos carnosus]
MNNHLDALIKQVEAKLREPLASNIDKWKNHLSDLINQIAEVKLDSAAVVNGFHVVDESLDPTDWTSARCVAHTMLDASLDFVQTVRERPVWQPIPDRVRSTLERESLPQHGQSMSDVCDQILVNILPYSTGNVHPRFWAWVHGAGTIGGVIGEMMAATMNSNAGFLSHSAVLVERTVLGWMGQMFGFPADTVGGIIVSGTSMATLICMAVAHNRALANVRETGLVGGPRLVAYASSETHMCVVKALELIGVGSAALRLVPVDEQFRMNIDELKKTIREDRNNGLTPFCIVGNAGTVSTGAFDDLGQLASIARCEGVWFHVDGAFGSLIVLDPKRRSLATGLEQADSVAFDFHKWLHCSYDAGCALVRDRTELHATFSTRRHYLAATQRGCAGENPWFCELGPELSRSFRALKVWFTLKEHGLLKLGQKIADNCEQAQYLGTLLAQYSSFIRVVTPISLNVVNFRLEPDDLLHQMDSPEIIDVFNNEIAADMQESGIALPSTACIRERLYIRVAITNHRSTLTDFDIFVKAILDRCRDRLAKIKE